MSFEGGEGGPKNWVFDSLISWSDQKLGIQEVIHSLNCCWMRERRSYLASDVVCFCDDSDSRGFVEESSQAAFSGRCPLFYFRNFRFLLLSQVHSCQTPCIVVGSFVSLEGAKKGQVKGRSTNEGKKQLWLGNVKVSFPLDGANDAACDQPAKSSVLLPTTSILIFVLLHILTPLLFDLYIIHHVHLCNNIVSHKRRHFTHFSLKSGSPLSRPHHESIIMSIANQSLHKKKQNMPTHWVETLQ